MGFLKGCFAAYITVIIIKIIYNLSWRHSFDHELISIMIFSWILILPGCLLGELFYSKVVKNKNIILGLITYTLLGAVYVLFIEVMDGDFELGMGMYFYANSILGSTMFYIFRRH